MLLGLRLLPWILLGPGWRLLLMLFVPRRLLLWSRRLHHSHVHARLLLQVALRLLLQVALLQGIRLLVLRGPGRRLLLLLLPLLRLLFTQGVGPPRGRVFFFRGLDRRDDGCVHRLIVEGHPR